MLRAQSSSVGKGKGKRGFV